MVPYRAPVSIATNGTRERDRDCEQACSTAASSSAVMARPSGWLSSAIFSIGATYSRIRAMIVLSALYELFRTRPRRNFVIE